MIYEYELDPMDCAPEFDLDPVLMVERDGELVAAFSETEVRAMLARFSDYFEAHPERPRRYVAGGTSVLVVGAS